VKAVSNLKEDPNNEFFVMAGLILKSYFIPPHRPEYKEFKGEIKWGCEENQMLPLLCANIEHISFVNQTKKPSKGLILF